MYFLFVFCVVVEEEEEEHERVVPDIVIISVSLSLSNTFSSYDREQKKKEELFDDTRDARVSNEEKI